MLIITSWKYWVWVETWVERTWREPGREGAESDDHGMTLAWEWVDQDLNPLGLAAE